MTARGILDIVKEAVNIKGISAPSSLFVANDTSAAQLLAIVQETAIDSALRFDWQELLSIYDFTTVAGSQQFLLSTSDLQYRRKFIDRTFWDLTAQQRLRGPLSPQQWQQLRVINTAPLPYLFTIIAGNFLMPTTTEAGHDITLMWLDKRLWLDKTGATKQERCEADTDTFRLSENVMMYGIRWRYLQVKGLEYGEDFRKYEDLISEREGSNLPAENLNLNGSSLRPDDFDLGPSVPEGNWSF